MECKTILAIAENSGYPIDIAHDLKTKLTLRKQKQKKKKRKLSHVRNVQLIQYNNSTEEQTYSNAGGIYKLKCNTRNGVYVGQSGRTINVRYKERIRYIRINNSTCA
jgi:hypothetical protein